ncbi:MAG: exodeoxyribonuclease III [Rhodospirillaceae bacterium]|nr:exodeoxyribonuclease III [Rhodospirillaceae bacterium]
MAAADADDADAGTVTLATWNVNSIRARLPNVVEWLTANRPDIACLQELKCEEEKLPRSELEDLGYNVAAIGQKSYNGVAILSKEPLGEVRPGLPDAPGDDQARYLEAEVGPLTVVCLYAPNGNPVESDKFPYKLAWMERLGVRMEELLAADQPAVVLGDFNVIPEPEDCHDPKAWAEDALFRLETRRAYRRLLYSGWTDALRATTSRAGIYTFWDYQAGAWQHDNGIRIDHALLSPQATDLLAGCTVDRVPRGKPKASDHTPLVVTLRRPDGAGAVGPAAYSAA